MLSTHDSASDYLTFALLFVAALGAITIWLVRSGRGGRLVLLAWVVLLCTLVPGWFLTRAAEDAERRRLKLAIAGLAPTFADELQAMGHARIKRGTPPDDPLYLAMVEKQKRWLELNRQVHDVYTFRPGEETDVDEQGRRPNILIVDSETDYDRDGSYASAEREARTPIGTPWYEDSPWLAKAYEGKEGFDDNPYSDQWGTWVSAYVPMLDANGRVEAVLGVDYAAKDWLAALGRARSLAKGALAIFLVSVLSLLVVISVLRASLRERRRSAKRTRQIIDHAHEAFIAMDQRGRIVDWNPKATDVFGWAPHEVLGRTVADLLIPEREREAHEAGVLRFLETGEARLIGSRIEVSALHKDGHEFPMELTVAALEEADGYLFHAFMHDISERVERAEQLRRAKEGAEAATRAKSEFVASVSHEIRTPMNGIVGMCQILEATHLDEEQRTCLAQMKRSSDQLLHLVNDVLDMSKIEAGKVEIEHRPFELVAALEALAAAHRVRARDKGLELALHVAPDLPARVVGDAARLGQVLGNLIDNAIKFTSSGRIDVRVEQRAAENGTFEVGFAVEDTGIGIPADKQDSIFAAFSQEDASTTRRYGGTGLGLSICRHLVHLMGGRIEVASEPGRGATFRFHVRFGRAPAQDAAQADELYEAAEEVLLPRQGLRVLLVEDGEINQHVAVGLLELDDHRVTIAADGAAGVDAWREGSFDVILMDLQMPVMGGLEATRLIRAEEAARGGYTPIVALTAIAMKGDRDRCLAEGMDGYLAKPIDHGELRAALARAAPDAPTIDWAQVAERVPGGEDGARRLAALMQTEGPRLVAAIREAIEAGDAERAQREAHTLKGSAHHFLAEDVVRAARTIEEHAAAGDLDAARAMLPSLAGRVGAFSDALARQAARART